MNEEPKKVYQPKPKQEAPIPAEPKKDADSAMIADQPAPATSAEDEQRMVNLQQVLANTANVRQAKRDMDAKTKKAREDLAS